MTSKSKGMWMTLLAVALCAMLAGAVMAATAGQKAQAAPPAPPAPRAAAAPAMTPEPPDPQEEFIFIEDGRAWLGVTLSDINAEKARELKLSGEYGALVESVVEESPAAKAGVEKGDVITGFGGERVRSVAHLTRLVRETPAGRTVSLETLRGGQSRTFEVALEARRMHFEMPQIAVAPRGHVSPRVEVAPMPRFDIEMQPGPGGLMAWSRGPRLGVMTDEIDGQLAEYFGVKQGQGVLVKEVMEGSAAAKAGLKAGDVIVRINEDAVNDVDDLRRALNRAEKDVTVTVVRDRREQSLKVTLDEPQPRRPRRTAEMDEMRWRQQAGQQERELQAHLEALEQQMERQTEQQVQEQMRQLEERLRQTEQEVQERLQSEEFQKQMQQLDQQLKQQLDLQEFQKRMREFEFRYQELQRGREII